MEQLLNEFGSIVDTMNPYSSGNVALYFAWLVLYAFTAMAIWRSQNRWVRLLCFLFNQVFAVGVVISWTIVLILAYEYWIHSLAVLALVIALGWWTFRPPRPRETPDNSPRSTENRDNTVAIEGQYGRASEPGGAGGDRHGGV